MCVSFVKQWLLLPTHTHADNELSAIVVHVVVGDERDCSALPFIVTGPITRLASASNVKRCSKGGGGAVRN